MPMEVRYNDPFALKRRKKKLFVMSCPFSIHATGIFEGLLTPEDAVFSDQLNHASIIDGLRLCKAQKYRYKHKGVRTGCSLFGNQTPSFP